MIVELYHRSMVALLGFNLRQVSLSHAPSPTYLSTYHNQLQPSKLSPPSTSVSTGSCEDSHQSKMAPQHVTILSLYIVWQLWCSQSQISPPEDFITSASKEHSHTEEQKPQPAESRITPGLRIQLAVEILYISIYIV